MGILTCFYIYKKKYERAAMSVNSLQLNKRTGFGATSFGSKNMGVNTQKSGIASQAKTNLENPNAASKKSIFSFTGQSGYHRIAGQNTLKEGNSLARRREGLGNATSASRRSGPQAPSPRVIYQQQPQTQEMSGFEKALIYTSIGMQAFAQGAQLFGGITGGQALDAGFNSLGSQQASTVPMTASSIASGVLSGMSSAQCSGALNSAIQNAESQLSSMQAQNEAIEQKGAEAKEHLKEYEKVAEDKEKACSEAQQGVKNADNKVKVKTDIRESKKLALDNAISNFERAKATFDSLPADDPQKAAAKSAMDAAEAKKNDAQRELENVNSELDTAVEEQTAANEKFQTAKAESDEANSKCKEAKDDIQKAKDHKHDTEQLEKGIKQQKERLTNMIKKENDRIKDIDNKIQKLTEKNDKKEAKIDTSDGMSFFEKRRAGGIEDRNQKIQQLLAEKNVLIAGQASS